MYNNDKDAGYCLDFIKLFAAGTREPSLETAGAAKYFEMKRFAYLIKHEVW